MTRANKKKKFRGEPPKYKSTNVNFLAIDFAIEVDGKYYRGERSIYRNEVLKYKSLFLSFLKDRKQRKEKFSHQDAVSHCLNLMD